MPCCHCSRSDQIVALGVGAGQRLAEVAAAEVAAALLLVAARSKFYLMRGGGGSARSRACAACSWDASASLRLLSGLLCTHKCQSWEWSQKLTGKCNN
jgi:hypothetical protein